MTDAAFWDRIAPRYADRPISDIEAYEATIARVKTHLRDTDRALELGCGTGSTALLLSPHVASYTGLDISQGMLDIARDKAWNATQTNLSFVEDSAEARSIAPGAVDTVLAFNLLHLVQTEEVLARMHALLPRDGLLISKTPCVGAKWYNRPLIGALRLVGRAPAVRYLTIDSLDEMVEQAGFEIVETGLYPPSTPSRFIVARKL
mgnify:FL=1